MKSMLYITFHLHFLSISVVYSIPYSIQLHAGYFYTFLSSVDIFFFYFNHYNRMPSQNAIMVSNYWDPQETHSVIAHIQNMFLERSGSVVECFTRDREAAGSSLTGVTSLWSLSKTHLS